LLVGFISGHGRVSLLALPKLAELLVLLVLLPRLLAGVEGAFERSSRPVASPVV
jgi:hypothetical protein